ncbi:hypothetical protein SAMN05192583_0595 [Sphingomonas gellani]|uniref:Uncharacterized protein n=1 Tax=Sphingomonas gellani TaxID=1166340 RepID=A0A1H7Z9W1_9SPHN|nr:hypothetical protein [Sphingomonas gellani]SEM55106.1 hypothetical protein SAMN05192583_0595 [Sphingomonas gellani]
MLHQPELDSATERFLIDGAGEGATPVPAAIAPLLADAAGHAADALPELLILARGGQHFATRFRRYADEVIHCLASGLEAVLIASHDAEAASIGLPRKDGEDALAAACRDYLDRAAG